MNAADVKDCLAWSATELPKELAAAGDNNGTLLDATRIAVSGSSAGGYLALLAGLYATGPVKPKVILPIYPITDPLGTFFTTPQPHPAGHIERAALGPCLDPKAPVQTRTAWEGDPRARFYFYMMQEAILAVSPLCSCHGSPSFMLWDVLECNTSGSIAGLTSYSRSCCISMRATIPSLLRHRSRRDVATCPPLSYTGMRISSLV